MAKNEMVTIGTEKFEIDRPEWKGYRNRIKIFGSTGNEYVVSQRVSDGVWRCNCMGARGEKTCKHLRNMAAGLQLVDAGAGKKRLT